MWSGVRSGDVSCRSTHAVGPYSRGDASMPCGARVVANGARAGAYTAAVIAVLAGCSDTPVTPQDASPVISLTLVAGESLHVAILSEAVPADQRLPRTPPPLDSSRVDLQVVDEQGSVYPLVATELAGRFSVSMQVEAGALYELTGTIDGVTVSSTTVLPTSFTVATPAGDTIGADDGVVHTVTFHVPYRFEGLDLSGFEARTLDEPAGRGQLMRGHEGEMVFLRPDDGDETTEDLLIFGYNQDATEWLVRTVPRSNIEGAFGGFGGALLERRYLVIP